MPSISNTRERSQIEPKTDTGTLSAATSIGLHWPEYLMEAGEAGLYLFSACTVATLLWHPASPIQRSLPSDAVRRMLMGLAMGATIIAIARLPWGKQSGAHFNPAVTITFYRLGKAALWDAVFYCTAQLLGAVAGVALASLVLQGAPAHKAVRYAATVPGIYGDAIALVAELALNSFGVIYARQDEWHEAERYFRRAIELQDTRQDTDWSFLRDAYKNYEDVLRHTGRKREAKALELRANALFGRDGRSLSVDVDELMLQSKRRK